MALICLMSGCGGTHSIGKVSPSVPVRGTPSPPTPLSGPTTDVNEPPVRPEALDGTPSKEAAVALARYYMALHVYAFQTGRTAPLRDISGEGCRFCADDVAAVNEIYGAGRHESGGDLTVTTVTALELAPGASWLVNATAQESPTTVINALGKVVDGPTPFATLTLRFVIRSKPTLHVEEIDATETPVR
jgi:hypothetical protein